jgi:NADPH:quinone reductase-like Zn-dependent oxidoreductase
MDCTVVGVVGSSHKLEAARAAGADHVIDKSKEKLWRRARALSPDGYDVVLDANGVSTLRGSYRSLRPTGRLVIYGFHSMLPRSGGRPNWAKLALDYVRTPRFDPLQLTNDNKSVQGFNLSYLFERADLLAEGMAALSDLLGQGKIRPLGTECVPFVQVAEAHRRLESAMTTGKLVLQI